MGTDCKLKVGDEYHSLDRWYVFSPKISSKHEISKSLALKLIRDLNRTKTLMAEVKLWGERSDEFFNRHRHWLMKARQIIKSCKCNRITFYTEHDIPDEYYTEMYNN